MMKNAVPYKGTNLAPGSKALELYQNAKKPEDWKKLDQLIRECDEAEKRRRGDGNFQR